MTSRYLLSFQSEKEFLTAIQLLQENHIRDIEAFSSYDIKTNLFFSKKDSAINIVKFAALLGALMGILTGYGMPWYASVVDNPFNSGGRPLNSWPVFIPITFVLAVLFSGGFAFIAFMLRLRFPEPYNPIFNSTSYNLEKHQFYISLSKAPDRPLLQSLKAHKIEEFEA
jgi:nitrate reductase NapE component